MSRGTPQLRDLAQSLIADESKRKAGGSTREPTVLLIFEKLRPPLATLMGTNGFRALLLRALTLAKTETAWLQAVHVKADGSLVGLAEMHAKIAPEEFLEGKVALLAQLLGLLVAFIGESLTLRLIHGIWPRQARTRLKLGKRIKK